MATSSISSGALAAGTYTLSGGRMVVNALLLDPATNITVYDNATAASGKVLMFATNQTTSSLDIFYNVAVSAQDGVTVVVAGTGNAYVFLGGF